MSFSIIIGELPTHIFQPDNKKSKGKPPEAVVHKTEERPLKKRRIPEDESTPVKAKTAKPGDHLGSLIGRKRRIRKAGNKGPRC